MNRVQVTISYGADAAGLVRPDDVLVLKPVHLVAAERHFKGNPPGVEGTLWAAWYALRVEAPFADWLESIVAVSEETVPPSSATAPATSPTSP